MEESKKIVHLNNIVEDITPFDKIINEVRDGMVQVTLLVVDNEGKETLSSSVKDPKDLLVHLYFLQKFCKSVVEECL